LPIDDEIVYQFIGKPRPGRVMVYTGPNSVTFFDGERILLDGRKYSCDGRVFFRTGQEVRAKFVVDTTSFEFLSLNSVICYVGDLWYRWDEDALYEALGTTKELALPFTWEADRPLDYHIPGPYPMRRFEPRAETSPEPS
jgi:hypothetical protein